MAFPLNSFCFRHEWIPDLFCRHVHTFGLPKQYALAHINIPSETSQLCHRDWNLKTLSISFVCTFLQFVVYPSIPFFILLHLPFYLLHYFNPMILVMTTKRLQICTRTCLPQKIVTRESQGERQASNRRSTDTFWPAIFILSLRYHRQKVEQKERGEMSGEWYVLQFIHIHWQ